MSEKVFLFLIGVALIALSKYFAMILIWWQKAILGYEPMLSEWYYKGSTIFVGVIFVIISIIKN